jgi:hypothetical protein
MFTVEENTGSWLFGIASPTITLNNHSMFYIEMFNNGNMSQSLGKYGVLCYTNTSGFNEWRIIKTTPSVDSIIAGAPLTAVTYLLHADI